MAEEPARHRLLEKAAAQVGMEPVRFSIVVPTYNRAGLIAKTLASLLTQDYENYEVLVVDDGGTDNTQEVVEGIGDARLKYYRKENGERGAARNFGAKLATGDYVNFFDSDDIAYPHHIAEGAAVVAKYDRPEVFFLPLEWVKPDGKVLKRMDRIGDDLNRQILKGNMFSCNGVFVRRDVALEFPFSENRLLSGTEDWELWIRLAARFPLRHSNRVTSALVHHEDRSVLSYEEKELWMRSQLLMKHLRKDKEVVKQFGDKLDAIQAHQLSYSALHLAMSGKKKAALKFFKGALKSNPGEFFKRRTLAILKYILI